MIKIKKPRKQQQKLVSWNKDEILDLISICILKNFYEKKGRKIYFEDFIKTKTIKQIRVKLQKFQDRINKIYNFFLEYYKLHDVELCPKVSVNQSIYCIKEHITNDFLHKFKETSDYKEYNFNFLSVIEVQNIFKPANDNIINDISSEDHLLGKQNENLKLILNIETNFYNFLKSQSKDKNLTIDMNAYFSYLSYKKSRNQEN